MTMRRTYLVFIAALVLSVIAAPRAQATYLVKFEQLGANVEEEGSGTLDTTDLSVGSNLINNDPFVAPSDGDFQSGAANEALALFGFVTGPKSFGPSDPTSASSSGGDAIGIGGGTLEILLLSPAYVSGTPLPEFSIYSDASFASLGMIPGVYVWSWGSGAHADTFRIDIIAGSGASPVPEPSTWAMMLIGFLGLGYAAVRKRAVRAISG
jgi:PEP-CTERM motif